MFFLLDSYPCFVFLQLQVLSFRNYYTSYITIKQMQYVVPKEIDNAQSSTTASAVSNEDQSKVKREESIRDDITEI